MNRRFFLNRVAAALTAIAAAPIIARMVPTGSMKLVSLSVSSAGSGYIMGDAITASGGTGITAKWEAFTFPSKYESK